jgi:glycosyltransferase involved in cell wall biosynthesis
VRKAAESADKCLFLNQEDANYATDKFKIDPKDVFVTSNGITHEFVGLGFKKTRGRKIGIAQIGDFGIRKGYDMSMPVFKDLVQSQDVRVFILGTGSNEEKVLENIPDEVKRSIIVIPSYEHENLPNLLKDIDIFVFPTRAEGFGIALVEAMACGLAPITTDVGGPRDIVEHEDSGILISPGNADELRYWLIKLIHNEELRLQIAESAYVRAQEYDWAIVANNRLSWYSRMLNADE